MATVNFSVPNEVKERFNEAFAHRNKSAVISELMLRAVEEAEAQQIRVSAIDQLLARRAKKVPVSAAAVRRARKAARP